MRFFLLSTLATLAGASSSVEVDEFGIPRATPALDTKTWTSIYERIPNRVMQSLELKSVAPDSTSTYVPIGDSIGGGHHSQVYLISLAGKAYAIKYHSFCGDKILDPDDTIVKEAMFLNFLAGSGVTNDYVYHSAAVPVIPEYIADGKVKVVPCTSRWAVRETPQIRYLITSVTGISLIEYKRFFQFEQIPFFDAIQIGFETIALLQQLHERNVFHGDIHAGNIVFAEGASGPLRLIDFGRAGVFTPHPAPCTLRFSCFPIGSVWECAGCKATYRDDVYRMILLMAFFVHGTPYTRIQRMMCPDQNEVMQFKGRADLFDPKDLRYLEDGQIKSADFSLRDRIDASVSDIDFATIRLALRRIQNHVRSLHATTVPDHGLIMHGLKSILDLDPRKRPYDADQTQHILL